MLSIVIPVFNESGSLRELHRQLSAVATEHSYRLDIIFVDDGSNDGSWEIIDQLGAEDPAVRGIRFRRNFGKAAALNAGFATRDIGGSHDTRQVTDAVIRAYREL